MTPTVAQVASKILSIETAGGRSADAVAAGTAKACDKIAKHLASVIGEQGIRAVYARGLNITRGKFPCLAGVGTAPSESPWTQLETCLAAQHPDAALEASVAFLANVVGLLTRFIGNGLTARLLRDLWPEALPARSPEETT